MTPELELHTAYVIDARGRIQSTREPRPGRCPLFTIIRTFTGSAWAVRADLGSDLADEIASLARAEPPIEDLRAPPLHAARYLSRTGGHLGFNGPAFLFPIALETTSDVVVVDDERLLDRNFRGWHPGEIATGGAPVMAIAEEGHPVSICFSARHSEIAAAAGVETAAAFRGRGLAPRVVAAWAVAVRASGRVPLYSAAWTNAGSLSVARKLGLRRYAAFWSVSE